MEASAPRRLDPATEESVESLRVALVIVTDGREDYLARSTASAKKNLPEVDHTIVVDDTAHKLGFAGAVNAGWVRALETDADFIFWLEEDFIFNEPVNLEAMAELAADPHIAQVCLKRQAWNAEEIAAGGIVELNPDDFKEGTHNGHTYTAHRRFFSTNPSIYRRDIAERGWPQEDRSEGKFSIELFKDPHVVSTFWGGKFDAPKVHHIGDERAGHGY